MTTLTGISEWPSLHDPASDRLILRDGTAALIRPTVAADRDVLERFFHALTAESRYQRFFIAGEPAADLIARFCDSSNPRMGVTLLALRRRQDAVEAVAVALYLTTRTAAAEVAFAVADGLHGKGIGTAMLERLAAIATQHGIEQFEATTLAGNREMLRVFHDSGFEMRTTSADGLVDIRLALQPSAMSATAIGERDRIATAASLKPILQPGAVAVIGVSRNAANLGRRVFESIQAAGFKGTLYAVNPHATEIAGQPCFGSVRDLPSAVDLAVIATPRDEALRVVDECAAAGVRGLVVISAGFAEVDEAGRTLQRELVERARGYGMRMIGPNCMGVLNTHHDVRLNASFAEQLPPEGRLAIASQSGGIGLALLELACARHLGISTFVSLGNKADVSGNDLLQWGESDPNTSVLLLYLESFGNPRRFAQLARRIGAKKPIVVVKAGRTASGSRAAGSHTAGLASNEAAVAALFKQSGVIRAETIDEMFDVGQCLDLQPLPRGARVGIVTNTGGPGILAADACEAAGLTITPFGETTRAALAQGLSPNASLNNPIDLVASAGAAAYEHAIVTALASPDIDSLIVMYTPIDRTQTAGILEAIGRAVARARAAGIGDKPVLACTLSMATQPAPLAAAEERIPTYMFPENAARALARAAAYSRWRDERPALFWGFDDIDAEAARAVCQRAIASRGDTWLTGDELRDVLKAFGLPLAAARSARTEEQAVAAADTVGYPAVLKLESPGLLHKTDIGGVRLHLEDAQAVRMAFGALAGRFPDLMKPDSPTTVQVQRMLTGVETLVGVTEDPTFGPLVAFGLGGVEAELVRDVAFRMAPLSDRDVDEMLREVRCLPLLRGFRGRPPADVRALRELLFRVSLLAREIPELQELDLNPVMVLPDGKGCQVVDARARVAGK